MFHSYLIDLLRKSQKSSPVLLFASFLTVGSLLNASAGAILKPKQPEQNTSERAKQIASAFQPFSPKVRTRSDDRFFYVESNGIPDHRMMVGITNWQQQVPLPQPYIGKNAWQFPLTPVPATNPLSGRTHFFRGAMAIAADGIPIFNALNNRGEDSYQIGELDEFGGHCGRADDYHYHIAPTALQKKVGRANPLGYALDGYALYGLTEPDGSTATNLDAFNGHTTAKLGYHYHATKTYPYLNGGFHGEVIERDGQVDPQPRAQPVRPDTPPLRGAKITGFEQPSPGSYSLTYTIEGQTCKVNYAVQPDGSYRFDYIDARGTVYPRIYRVQQGRGDRGNRPPRREGPPGDEQPQQETRAEATVEEPKPSQQTSGFVLRSPAVGSNHKLPIEFTGDGSSISPPLEWSGAPVGTKSYAVIMHHIDPQGMVKWYWTLYNIPPDVHRLPKNVQGVGTVGNNSINNEIGYAPPHSKGPGAKTYILTLYALSEAPKITVEPYRVSRAVLLTAMKGKVLATSELRVVYTRSGMDNRDGQ